MYSVHYPFQCLLKAHRCRSGPDLYKAAAPVLSTLTREKDDIRSRDILPGEQGFESIYDMICGPKAEIYYKTSDLGEMSNFDTARSRVQEAPRGFFYSDADALEDQVLFPEKHDPEDPLAIRSLEPLRTWENEGFSMREFIKGGRQVGHKFRLVSKQ